MAEAYYALPFNYRVRLGLQVESLCDYVAAYFRGSSAGPWWPDEELERPDRVLQFSRGNWHMSDRTGKRTPLPILRDNQGRPLPATRPAQLAVAVQPLPDGGTVIAIHYRYLFPVAETDAQLQRDHEKACWEKTTQTEVGELVEYLRDSMRITEVKAEV